MSKLAEEWIRYRQLAQLIGLFGYHHLFRLGGSLVDPEEGVIDHRVGQLLARRTLARLDLPVVCSGLERIAELRNYAVISNHSSYLDWAVLLGYFPSPLRFVAKRELSRLPVVGGFLKHRGILIDRSRGKDAKTSIRQAIFDENQWPIMLFPEGTRSPNGELRPFKRGGLRLLVEAGLTVVPVCIRGTYEAFPRHARHIRSGSTLELQVLEPVNTERSTDPEHAIDRLESQIAAAYNAERR
jgi:1-acyl-sn-glycerol-3-phosphate acyltransferase